MLITEQQDYTHFYSYFFSGPWLPKAVSTSGKPGNLDHGSVEREVQQVGEEKDESSRSPALASSSSHQRVPLGASAVETESCDCE